MKKYQKGFIPLIAIIVLGVLTITGSTIATIGLYNKEKKVEQITPEPIKDEVSSKIEEKKQDVKIEPSIPKTVYKNTDTNKINTVTEIIEPPMLPSDTSKIPEITTDISEIVKEPEIKIEEPEYITVLKKFTKSSPYLSDYRSLCKTAKSINTEMIMETLSEDRKDIEETKVNLYDAMRCNLLDDANYLVIEVRPGLFKWKLETNDTDAVRTKKISYNKVLESLNLTQYQFLIHGKCIDANSETRELILKKGCTASTLIFSPEKQALYFMNDRPNNKVRTIPSVGRISLPL